MTIPARYPSHCPAQVFNGQDAQHVGALCAYEDNGDGMVSDQATELMWMKADSGAFGVGPNGDGTVNWEEALDWADNLVHAGYDDWRLPNAKELQSIVDYTRAPLVTGTAAIDVNYFDVTETESFFWATTTYIIDNSGTVLHTWPSGYDPRQAVYALDDGSILRTIRLPGVGNWGGPAAVLNRSPGTARCRGISNTRAAPSCRTTISSRCPTETFSSSPGTSRPLPRRSPRGAIRP